MEATPQIEADRRLLKFKTYEDYLDSLVTPADLCYMQSVTASRTLAELGYRSTGATLSRKQFERRLAAVIAYLYPTFKPYELASERMPATDDLQKELAIRERPNRLGILATIIFLRNTTSGGFEVSGYIDYGDRLKIEDWKPFFRGKRRLWPKPTDLGYYHWRLGASVSNDSFNFKVIVHPKRGLLFQNRFDRKVISVDPVQSPGSNSTRLCVLSPIYDHVVLLDHVVIQRI
ncbi:cilia- and flagella-associated protein 299-like [Atheta coriaria]|uniref:cilia- and flagella-associated protein 299-like n=1 Tax=Dalotia coriaria TaxID=877792 RepID=UPI0031F337D7